MNDIYLKQEVNTVDINKYTRAITELVITRESMSSKEFKQKANEILADFDNLVFKEYNYMPAILKAALKKQYQRYK